jgi:hypothetical protein
MERIATTSTSMPSPDFALLPDVFHRFCTAHLHKAKESAKNFNALPPLPTFRHRRRLLFVVARFGGGKAGGWPHNTVFDWRPKLNLHWKERLAAETTKSWTKQQPFPPRPFRCFPLWEMAEADGRMAKGGGITRRIGKSMRLGDRMKNGGS